MKVLMSLFIGIVACFGVAGAAVITGIVPIPSSAVVSHFKAIPPLQPAAAQTPTPTPSPADMTITVSERFLNGQLALGMASGGEITNPKVDVHANNLGDFTATLKTGFLTLSPKASVQLSVVNGRIVIDVLRVDVGGFGIPNSLIEPEIAQLKTAGETALNTQLDAMRTNAGLKLQTLTTTENGLTLSFIQ